MCLSELWVRVVFCEDEFYYFTFSNDFLTLMMR